MAKADSQKHCPLLKRTICRAYCMEIGDVISDEYGLHLVVVSAYANTCKLCEPWQGKILIDDVFSHPSKEFIEENKQYPLLSEVIEKRLLNPNCRHTLTTYFPGVTRLPVGPYGKKAIELYSAEQRQRYI